MSDELVRQFADLFAGRVDVYGSDIGGCIKEPLTLDIYEGHLTGGITSIGVYPQRDGDIVKWGCSDIDVADPVLARNLQLALNGLGIRSYVELTRSAHYHVWVFSAAWIAAKTMRRALLVAHDVAGVPPKEVNPKQETLEGQSVGNYVRLPYPGGLNATPTRRVMQTWYNVTYKGALQLRPFLRDVDPNAPALIERAAALWKPPAKKEVLFDGLPPVDRELTQRLSGLAYTIFTQGPYDTDRSAALYKLAAKCKDDGLSPSEALVLVTDADQRWGKYSARADGPRWLRTTVERAYQ